MSEHVFMVDVLKYAVVERERRFVVAGIPEGVTQTLRIEDYYIEHTRLRLRRVMAADGSFKRKLGHKVRLGQGAFGDRLYRHVSRRTGVERSPDASASDLAQDPSHRREGRR